MFQFSVLRFWRELIIAALAIVVVFLWQVNRLNRDLYATANSSLISMQQTAEKTQSSQTKTVVRTVQVIVKPDGTKETTTTDTNEKTTSLVKEREKIAKREASNDPITRPNYSVTMAYLKSLSGAPDQYLGALGMRLGSMPLFAEVVGFSDRDRKHWGVGLGLRLDF